MENIKKLVKLANSLDQKGYHVEADLLDSIINKMAQDESKTIDKYILKTKGDPFQYSFKEGEAYFKVHSVDAARATEQAKSGGKFSDAVGKKIERNTPAFNNLVDRIHNLTGTKSEVIPVYKDSTTGSPLPQGHFERQEAYVASTPEYTQPLDTTFISPKIKDTLSEDEEYFEELMMDDSMELLEPEDALDIIDIYFDVDPQKAYDLAYQYVNFHIIDSHDYNDRDSNIFNAIKERRDSLETEGYRRVYSLPEYD